jgi:isoaspartyl peptidase/L-asparaginase-like protein (Ntn-hydrolase superfamily)
MTTPVLVLHGGAGVLAQRSYDREIDHLSALAERTRDALLAGQSALDAVVEAVPISKRPASMSPARAAPRTPPGGTSWTPQ